MSNAISTKPVKGTRDFFPEDFRLRNWLFEHWRAVTRQFGYDEYDSCPLEHEELYIRKAGDEITSQLYNFSDKGDRRVSLRPEMTPTLARMAMASGATRPLPLRWMAIPQCFRYERAQKGRKREHFQWNMDIVGLATVAAEVELISAQCTFLERVGLVPGVDVRIRLSDRRVLQDMLASWEITGEQFAAVCVIIDKYDKIGADSTRELLSTDGGLQPKTAQRVLDLLAVRGLADLEHLAGTTNAGVVSLRELMLLAEAAGIGNAIDIDLSVVRGLSYYTGTVWEFLDAAGSMRAIAGGGRYDNLLASLGGPATPMVGFGFGDVVITDLLREKGLLPTLTKQLDAVVYPMSAGEFAVALQIARNLRNRGQTVQVDLSERRFKHVVARAELESAQHLYILGSKELNTGVVKQRELSSRTERTVPIAELLDGADA